MKKRHVTAILLLFSFFIFSETTVKVSFKYENKTISNSHGNVSGSGKSESISNTVTTDHERSKFENQIKDLIEFYLTEKGYSKPRGLNTPIYKIMINPILLGNDNLGISLYIEIGSKILDKNLIKMIMIDAKNQPSTLINKAAIEAANYVIKIITSN